MMKPGAALKQVRRQRPVVPVQPRSRSGGCSQDAAVGGRYRSCHYARRDHTPDRRGPTIRRMSDGGPVSNLPRLAPIRASGEVVEMGSIVVCGAGVIGLSAAIMLAGTDTRSRCLRPTRQVRRHSQVRADRTSYRFFPKIGVDHGRGCLLLRLLLFLRRQWGCLPYLR